MQTIVTSAVKHIKENILYNSSRHIAMESNEEIASRLKFIGFIERDEKINVRFVNRQKNNFYTILSRMIFYPDNRSNALRFVKDVISRSFEIIEQHLNKENYLDAQSMIEDLIRSQKGLANLKYTYADDTKFCCDVDVLIGKVQAKLTILRENHSDLFVDRESE